MVDPQNIKLSDDQRSALAQTAHDAGKPWPQVFTEALEQYRLTHNGSDNKATHFGAGKGVMVMADDFDAPLEDFREYTE